MLLVLCSYLLGWEQQSVKHYAVVLQVVLFCSNPQPVSKQFGLLAVLYQIARLARLNGY